MTTGKTIALTRRTFVGKVMSLLVNMPSRLVITFLPKSKRLLISWLQSPSAVILEPSGIAVVQSRSHVQLFATPWTVAYQASPSMGFSRQEYWSGLPFPSPGTNLESIFKSRDITLPTKVHLVKAMVFQVVMHGCES